LPIFILFRADIYC